MTSVRRKRLVRWAAWLAILLGLLVLTETVAQVVYRVQWGEWRVTYDASAHEILFEPHPYLIGAPRPDTEFTSRSGVTLTHNSLGTRGRELSRHKAAGITRIVAIGGSSTYCVGVGDDDTWPARLEVELGTGYEVVNMGVPGYSSLENLVQTCLLVSDLDPDICVFYIGWNDLRQVHIQDSKPDYTDFHASRQYSNLNIMGFKRGQRSAVVYYAVQVIRNLFINKPAPKYIRTTPSKLTDEIDERALSLFSRNISLIIAACRELGIRPVFVPQIMNRQLLTGDNPDRSIPLIRLKDVPTFTDAYNEALRKICEKKGVDLAEAVLEIPWKPADFIDIGHFTPEGSRKFAEAVAVKVRAE